MKYSKALFTATACAWITLYGASALAAAQTSGGKQDTPQATYGDIVFYNSKGEKKCTLSVPETKQAFDFSQNNQTCENNSAASFTLENIPSATLIQFYANESCSDARVGDNFFVKLKTVKQPTDWTSPPAQMNFNDLRKKEPGDLIPKKNIRVEARWQGHEFDDEDWDEQISCVYIERSQPVN
ncbi:hypothetical protein ACN1C3_33045 [Pseudomonas sp. H11T01]|uniref:hypothetical protein n=1 Tax=Pseudomonas sp. H11T01 TaxID=3402749 RepID=UPI003AC5B9D7